MHGGFQLRPYQQDSCDAALSWMKASVDPALIDAAPAAGKSYMIAYVAEKLHKISGGKRVLVLAPSAELVRQNFQKFLLTGERASMFSASAGVKSTRHYVVFATPKTVSNSISRFKNTGEHGYAAVIVDEAHGMTPTIRSIIEQMMEANPNLRVLGLSGTPFGMSNGYIFRAWPDNDPYGGKSNGDETCRNPYFTKCVYRVSARQMLDEGFITPMVIGSINQAQAYDTSGLVLLPNGTFNSSAVERAFEGHGRKTAAIVADVLQQARNRKGGIMYFAATVRHAQEILASLPPATSAMVTGADCVLAGRKATRKTIIAAYRDKSVRHLVSVGTLTTGFDVEHTETIALLRATESASLLQQILGRAWRLHEGKSDSLLLDYAGNVEKHFPDGDIYNPNIKAGKVSGGNAPCDATCPDCSHVNEFSRNPDCDEYELDANGYCVDVFGARVETEYGPMSGHYGRRCFGLIRTGPKGEHERCSYRWTGKDCPACQEKNDIAARYCYSCKAEIVDPNEKLAAEFKAMKKDPTRPQTDKILSMTLKDGVSRSGNRTIRADWVTPYRQFSTWHMPDANNTRGAKDWAVFDGATRHGQPDTITYAREIDGTFYRIITFNRPEDVEPNAKELAA